MPRLPAATMSARAMPQGTSPEPVAESFAARAPAGFAGANASCGSYFTPTKVVVACFELESDRFELSPLIDLRCLLKGLVGQAPSLVVVMFASARALHRARLERVPRFPRSQSWQSSHAYGSVGPAFSHGSFEGAE